MLPDAISWENEGSIYGTKKVRQVRPVDRGGKEGEDGEMKTEVNE